MRSEECAAGCSSAGVLFSAGGAHHDRQAHGELTPFAKSPAFGLDGAAVHFDQAFHQCQPNA